MPEKSVSWLYVSSSYMQVCFMISFDSTKIKLVKTRVHTIRLEDDENDMTRTKCMFTHYYIVIIIIINIHEHNSLYICKLMLFCRIKCLMVSKRYNYNNFVKCKVLGV